MKNAGKARSYGLYRHLRTSKEIIENLLNYSYKYSGEIALKSVLCAVAEHHARQPKRHIGEERQNRQHR